MKHAKTVGRARALLGWICLVALSAHANSDIVMADFEGVDYGDWKVQGTAFGEGPARANVSPPNRMMGYQGHGLVNTYLDGDATTGTLTSPEFTIERSHINFLIGAGNHAGRTCMNLLVDGRALRTAVGSARKDQGREVMEWGTWDVKELVGRKAMLQIVDDHTGGWGHINIDQVTQSDRIPEGAIKHEEKPMNWVELSRTFDVDNTHLVVPVSNSGQGMMHLGMYLGEQLIQSFNVSLPSKGESHWLASYPLAHFDVTGKSITIKPVDGQKVGDIYAEAFGLIHCGDDLPAEAAADYAKPYRNQFHVSTRRGWNNDPNGMVVHQGTYHLYYQYNPFGISWGNMHWGHFQSDDLIHWRERPIALYQKTVGDMMFSGGGFIDFNDSAGLGEGTQFAAFTSTGRGECLAYSRDGGQTFTELPENPVVKHQGRDPKIIWYEPEQKWVMAVYDVAACAETEALPVEPEHRQRHANIAFYASNDLRNWRRTGGFTDPDRSAVHECPELFELPVVGKQGESRWILYGAQNRYFVGHFDGTTFTKESGPHGSTHGAFYAAQTFSDVPDGRRIQIGWVRTAIYVGRFADQVVNQSFSLPHQLTLRETTDGLRLFFLPVREVESLRGKLLAEGSDLSAIEAGNRLQVCVGEPSEVVIEFAEKGRHEVMVNGIDATFEGSRARIFTDRTFNEVYADKGLYYELRTRSPVDFDSTATGLGAGTVKSLQVYRMKSIWP